MEEACSSSQADPSPAAMRGREPSVGVDEQVPAHLAAVAPRFGGLPVNGGSCFVDVAHRAGSMVPVNGGSESPVYVEEQLTRGILGVSPPAHPSMLGDLPVNDGPCLPDLSSGSSFLDLLASVAPMDGYSKNRSFSCGMDSETTYETNQSREMHPFVSKLPSVSEVFETSTTPYMNDIRNEELDGYSDDWEHEEEDGDDEFSDDDNISGSDRNLNQEITVGYMSENNAACARSFGSPSRKSFYTSSWIYMATRRIFLMLMSTFRQFKTENFATEIEVDSPLLRCCLRPSLITTAVM